MKKLFLITSGLVFCTASILFGQNLVPNPSFEEYVECPYSTVTNLIEVAQDWYSFRGSPNYFNTCIEEPSFPLWDVPYNGWGYQYPATGNAYGSFYTYGNPSGGSADYREYIGTELMEPLNVGSRYFVTFKVVRATSGFYYSANWATNKIGAFFSTAPYYSDISDSLVNYAQVYSDSLIKDTINWNIISGSFIADSSYQFVTFGNLFDELHTNAISLGSPSLGAFYYMDDVCVSTDSNYCQTWTSLREVKRYSSVKIYPNPRLAREWRVALS